MSGARIFGLTVMVPVSAVAIGGLALSLSGMQESSFPHSDHQGLFPLCIGCHEGIPTGLTEEWYPEPASCEGCHDGAERARVSWAAPTQRIDNVEFEHDVHERALEAEGDPPQLCAACHIPEGEGRMFVSEAIQLNTCWSCHETETHYDVEQACETCHVPVAETAFGRERLERLPVPISHDSDLFLSEEHGRAVPGRADRCATCHVQERCVSCHVDAGLTEIVAFPHAPASMVLPPMEATYPRPGSHGDEGWIDAHQVEAGPAECSTCHTQDDCRSCHVGIVPSVVEALATREASVAPGVRLVARGPDSHDSMFFMEAHSTLISSSLPPPP